MTAGDGNCFAEFWGWVSVVGGSTFDFFDLGDVREFLAGLASSFFCLLGGLTGAFGAAINI